jgi:Skp family chaperone for outer membrane proteins
MISKRMYILAIVGLLGVAAFLGRSLAQPAGAPAAAPRIAFCDLVSVFNEYERAKDLTEQLSQIRTSVEAERVQRQKKIDALSRELENYKKGSQQYERTAEDLMRQDIDLQAYLRYQEQVALRKHRAMTQEMYAEIVDTVTKIAVQQGYTIVMQKEQAELNTTDTNAMLQQIYNRKILYFAPSLDITETVLATLNRQYKDTKKAPPAAGAPAAPGGVR